MSFERWIVPPCRDMILASAGEGPALAHSIQREVSMLRSYRFLSLLIVFVLVTVGWLLSPSANSQQRMSQARTGFRNDPLPSERITAYRFVWFGQNKSGNLIFRTAGTNSDQVINNVGVDQIRSLLEILRSEGPVYFESETQLVYTGF